MNFHEVMNDLMLEVVKRTGKKPGLTREKDQFLDKLAGMIQSVVKTSYCDGVDLSISEKGNDLIVSFFGDDIEIQDGRKNPFYEFAKLANCADISSEGDTVHVAFTFFHVWELIPLE